MPWIERYLTAKRRRKVRQAGRPHSIFVTLCILPFPKFMNNSD